MRKIIRTVAQTTAAVARFAVAATRIAANAAYSPTMQEKAKQGATEISNVLFSQATAYSPVTADKASDNASRARFQQRGQSRGMER